jgi:hypothetical protein
MDTHACAFRSTFDDWETNRGLLDEVSQPKEECCLGSKHNKDLVAAGFPRDEAFKADKSFAATAVVMSKCKALTSALKMTYMSLRPDDILPPSSPGRD